MKQLLPLVFVAYYFSYAGSAAAHDVRPAYLELRQTSHETFDVLWKVPAMYDRLRLDVFVRLPEGTIAVKEPQGVFSGGAYFERWRSKIPGGLAGKTIRVDGLDTTHTDVLVRVEHSNGVTQIAHLLPRAPSFVIDAATSGRGVALVYFRLGMEHILLGVDHLLFVLGLLLLVDRRWMLVKTITAFTVAHSITLAMSVFGVVHAPAAPLNACIALSILFLGPEIVRKWRGGTSLTIRHPWVVAFAFGLLHGIGFASGLSLTGVPTSEIPLALLFFNLGVEAGQLAFVAVAIAVAWSVKTLQLDQPNWVAHLPAYAVGSLGAFWTIQRVGIILFQ